MDNELSGPVLKMFSAQQTKPDALFSMVEMAVLREFTLAALILGNVVKVVSHGDDRYGRTIGDTYLDDTLINLSLVKAGLAWHYVKYAPDNTALAEAEQQARELNNGLWSNAHGAIPPWNWRKMSNEERDRCFLRLKWREFPTRQF